MNTGQIQLRLTVSDQIYDYLQGWASRLGLPVTQVVKQMIVEQVKKEEFPIYRASTRTEKAYKEAMANQDKAIMIDDIDEYFGKLLKSK